MNNIKTEIEKAQDLANIHTEEIPISSSEVDRFIKQKISLEFSKKYSRNEFEKYWDEQQQIPLFLANGCLSDLGIDSISKEAHYIMRLVATWHIEQALRALKFDTQNDTNLREDSTIGNIGTAGRIAKIWGGNTLDSENLREYGDGRFVKMPRLAAFPNTKKTTKPVTVVINNVGLGSVCSHHFLPFNITNDEKSKIVIVYKPKNKLLGLSKIGRFVEWCLNRPSLQEEVTSLIFNKICEIAETDDVYVGLINLVHTCELTRGAKQYSTTTTEEYGGIYDNEKARNTIVGI